MEKEQVIKEINENIASGNKFVTLLFVGASVWWLANLVPYDLSETASGTVAGRLQHLRDLDQRAYNSCNSMQERYASASSYRPENCSLPLPSLPNRVGISLAEMVQLEGENSSPEKVLEILKAYGPDKSIELVKNGLDEAKQVRSGGGTQSPISCRDIIGKISSSLNECTTRVSELRALVSNITRDGNLDIGGVKIGNIHPRWHPAILMLILSIGVIRVWLLRQRVFSLLGELIASSSLTAAANSEGGLGDAKMESFLLITVPWWLLPPPSFPYPPKTQFFKKLASRAEYVRVTITFALVFSFVMLMLVSAASMQVLLSNFRPLLIEVKNGSHGGHSFGFTGSTAADLLLISTAFLVAFGLLCWSEPSENVSVNEPRLVNISRRRFVRGAGTVGGALLVSVTFPVFFDRQSALALAAKTAAKLGFPLNPRFDRKAVQFARLEEESGFYPHFNAERSVTILHYVKPEYTFTHQPSRGRKRHRQRVRHRIKAIAKWGGLLRKASGKKRETARLIHYPKGRMNVSHRMDIAKLGRAAVSDIAPFLTRESPHVRLRYYSEGIENQALEKWRAGEKNAAIDVLKIGLTYTKPSANFSGGRLNIRLYDLLAGILVRAGRSSELVPLVDELKTQIARLQQEIEMADVRQNGDVRAPPARLASSGATAVGVSIPDGRDGAWSMAQARMEKYAYERHILEKQIETLQSRVERWVASEGKWARDWGEGAVRKWAGIDM
ncbi:hypothetical protein [Rhizobium ruizarguesonis]|uniref:hypothetical protein n=1 Tax=Rhizobium ruizarguesonis TaxID=2081791 RepID=UPI00102F9DDF|nr:hypothetical protein [Rhizobium ruizarguesonis]TAT71084.1 hypothetical protein ELI52_36625 [Rhizobium ruizarguesonis]